MSRPTEVVALAERLDVADDLDYIPDTDLDPRYRVPTNAEKAAAILADGSRFLTPAEADRQRAIEEAARALLAAEAEPIYSWVIESQEARHEGRANREIGRMDRVSAAHRALREALGLPSGNWRRSKG